VWNATSKVCEKPVTLVCPVYAVKVGGECVCPEERPYSDGVECLACEAPQFWNESAKQCSVCQPGLLYNTVTKTCEACPADKPL
jgi:hypothetical protein